MSEAGVQRDPLSDDLTRRILDSPGGHRLLELDDAAIAQFLTAAEPSLSVRPDDEEVKAVVEEARTVHAQADLVLAAPALLPYGLVGAVAALEESGYTFPRCAGVGGGALVAAMLACGYTGNEIWQVLRAADVRVLAPPRRSRLVPRAEGPAEADGVQRFVRDLLGRRGVRTFRDLRVVSEYAPPMSRSLQALEARAESVTTSYDVVVSLLAEHPLYGRGRAQQFDLGRRPEDARAKPISEWLSYCAALFDPDQLSMLDGRRVICALAYRDAELFDRPVVDGFLGDLGLEIGTLDAELTPDAQKLRRARREGRPGTLDVVEHVAAWRLLVLAHDLNAGDTLALPRDAVKLGTDPDHFDASFGVAMAMALPGVIAPVVVRNAHTEGLHSVSASDEVPTGFFDVTVKPAWPTFAVRYLDGPVALDPADLARTIAIPAGRDPLDAPVERAAELFDAGRRNAITFLEDWDFARYVADFRLP